MPDEHTAAREHAIAQEIAAPRDSLPPDPTAQIADPQFEVVRRGYEKGQVDAYVRRVAQIVRDLAAQRSPREAIRQALDRVGEETAEILRRAHETAEDITTQSRAEADDRLEASRAEAANMLAAAKDRIARLDNDADLVWQERARILADVRRLSESLQGIAREADDRLPPEATTGEAAVEPPAAAPLGDVAAAGEDTARLPGDLAAEEPLPGESEEEAGALEPELEDDGGETREMSTEELSRELDPGDEPGAPPRPT